MRLSRFLGESIASRDKLELELLTAHFFCIIFTLLSARSLVELLLFIKMQCIRSPFPVSEWKVLLTCVTHFGNQKKAEKQKATAAVANRGRKSSEKGPSGFKSIILVFSLLSETIRFPPQTPRTPSRE
jgi:hypothetical protein